MGHSLRRSLFVSSALSVVIGLGGCSSSNGGDTSDAGTGGPLSGMVDDHCSGVTPIVVSAASCQASPDGGTAPDDGGTAGDGGEPPPAILFNAEGDDDDCKYHLKFTTTAVKKNQNVTFKVTVTKLADGTPATAADVVIESFLADNDLHPIPNNGTTTTESPAASGIYTVAPVKFDATGRWVVRFHLYESCFDLVPDSPHGHAAFFFDVP
jgi:hypothetical protein